MLGKILIFILGFCATVDCSNIVDCEDNITIEPIVDNYYRSASKVIVKGKSVAETAWITFRESITLSDFEIDANLLIEKRVCEEQIVGQKPNIVIIMTDDAEYSSVGFMGSEIETPNVDAWANSDALKYKRFYNNARCAPTRASLMTGHYPHCVGLSRLPQFPTYHPSQLGHVNSCYDMIPEYTEVEGYNNYMSGKWHLGQNNYPPQSFECGGGYEPQDNGFKDWFGIYEGDASYYATDSPQRWFDNAVPIAPSANFYATDTIFDRAITQIGAGNEPFFSYIPLTAPHAPRDEEPGGALTQKYIDLYTNDPDAVCIDRMEALRDLGLLDCEVIDCDKELFSNNNLETNTTNEIYQAAVYAAKMEKVDQGFGRLIQHLKNTGQYDNTIIMFFSDNGGDLDTYSGNCAAPFKGRKFLIEEGGILTHFAVSWPKCINEGWTDQKGWVGDILPTVMDIIDDYNPNPTIVPTQGISLKNNWKTGLITPREIFFKLSAFGAYIDENCKKYFKNIISGGDWVVDLNRSPCTQKITDNDPNLKSELSSKFQSIYNQCNVLTPAEYDAERACWIDPNCTTQVNQ